MSNTGRERLEYLGKSKSKTAKEHPNLEKWKIVDHTGQKIGTVHDLLFDREAEKVRYIIINLHNGELLQQDRLVLMPVGRARYRKSEEEVVFPNVTREQLSSLPDFFTIEDLSKEDEYAVRNAYSRNREDVSSTGDEDWDSFYDHDDFNEDSFYGRSNADKKTTTDTNRTSGTRVNKDEHAPDTSKKVKAGGGSDTLLTGTGDKKTMSKTGTGSSGNDKKRDDDVNVHPSPAERSSDRSGSDNTEGRDSKMTNTDKNDPGRNKEGNDRT